MSDDEEMEVTDAIKLLPTNYQKAQQLEEAKATDEFGAHLVNEMRTQKAMELHAEEQEKALNSHMAKHQPQESPSQQSDNVVVTKII